MDIPMEDFRAIMQGRFKPFKCAQCDGKGWYWVHENGVKRAPGKDESPDDFYRHTCDFDENDCGGSGFRYVIQD